VGKEADGKAHYALFEFRGPRVALSFFVPASLDLWRGRWSASSVQTEADTKIFGDVDSSIDWSAKKRSQ
jgi:hypothetical protein